MEDWFMALPEFRDFSEVDMEHIYEETHRVEQSFDSTLISDVKFDPHLLISKANPVNSYYLDR